MTCCNLNNNSNEMDIKCAQIKRAIKELAKSTEAKLLLQDKQIAETCIYIKQNLSNEIRTMLEAMRLSGELDNIITEAISEELTILENKLSEIYNISEFGITEGCNVNNNTSFNEAFSQNGNKNTILRFEDKTYGVTGKVYLYSNTTVDLHNAVIRNTGSVDSRLIFLNNEASVDKTGYGSLKNITFKNGTFEGNESGVMFALLHAENVEFNNLTFIDCCVSNHIFDLGGCKNVRFINCKFIGCRLSEEYNYRELIQPDYARYNGLPYWDETLCGYDNLPTVDLLIDRCTFEKGDGNAYPNAIGTHSIGDKQLENIIIRNCKFYDHTYSSIRLPKVKNLLIENNIFYNINQDTARGNRYAINLVSLSSANYDIKPSENVVIRNNEFLVDGGIGNMIGISFRGYSANEIVKNLVVRDNYFESTYDENTDGCDSLHTGYSENITYDDNTCYKIKNTFMQIANTTLHDVKFTNNTMKYCRDSIRGGSNELDLGMSNNLWIDDTGMINLNNFITTISLSADVTTEEAVTRNIPYDRCDNPFFTINSNNAINIPKQFKRIKATAYTMINISGEGTEPIFKTCVLQTENLNTSEVISNYVSGVFDRGYDRAFPMITNEAHDIVLDDRILRVSHRFTQQANETIKAIGTKIVIEGY